MGIEIPELKLPALTDLLGITRHSERCLTVVSILSPPDIHTWLRVGETQIQCIDPNRWLLEAYLNQGATDPEHSSAMALRLPLFGVRLQAIRYSVTTLVACILADTEYFRVPRPGYDPFRSPITHSCGDCKDDIAHIVVPEGFYLPPFDGELFQMVRGLQVQIDISG